MPFSKCDPGVLAELDGHWLECNYPKLERLARRQRRQQRLSEGSDGSSVSSPLPPLDLINSGILAMEHFFLAECEFQSRYLLASLDEIIGEMQPPRFPSNSLDRAIHEARRGLKEASPQERIVSNNSISEGLPHGKYTNYLLSLALPPLPPPPWLMCST